MMRDDRAGDAADEPLSRLLARSEAASREVEHVLARIDELVARLEQDGSGPGADDQVARVAEVDEVAEVDGVAEGQVAVEAPPARTVTVAASPTPRSDPWRYLTERLLLAHDAANGHANGDASVDHDIVILQEAARRRLSDER